MKKLILSLAIILPFYFFSACAKKGSASSIDPDDTIQGRTVIAMNPDSTPKVVYYYRTDPSGKKTDEVIREIHYFPGKKKYIDGGLKNNKRDGKWVAYFQNGNLNTEAFYIDGKEHGDYRVYYENGKLRYSGHFTNGICDGEWSFYNHSGLLEKKIEANENAIVCGSCSKCNAVRMKK